MSASACPLHPVSTPVLPVLPHLECTLRVDYFHQLLMTFCLIVFLSLYHLIPPDKHLPCPSLITPSFTTKNKISTSATTIKTLKLEAPSTFCKNAQNTGILFWCPRLSTKPHQLPSHTFLSIIFPFCWTKYLIPAQSPTSQCLRPAGGQEWEVSQQGKESGFSD